MKKTLLFLGLVFSMLTVCAEENILQSIEIVPVKDTYNIVLTADKSVDVKKTVQADNRITLNMKGIRASKTLNTIYNNVSNVDTVMVENTGNGVSIFFQAENAQAASISFDSIAPILPAKNETSSKQQIKLSSPIDTYAPVYREENTQGKTSALFDKITAKSSSLGVDLEDSVDSAKDNLHNIFSYGLLGLLGFAVIRLFRRKQPEMKIGLSQSLNEREIDMYQNAFPSSGYTNTDKPLSAVNYGLNAYKRGNENPYEHDVPIHNPRMQQYVSPLLRNQMARTAAMQKQLSQEQTVAAATLPTKSQQSTKKHTTPVNTVPVNQGNPNIDNLKFLESMTAIYEKSGRHDLAQGLRASLSKRV